MTTINKTMPILVTGGTGYLASWIVKQLLDQGYKVNTTVRSLENKSKYEHLLELHQSKENLKVFEADLLKEGSFSAAMEGCELIIHTASPFKISGIKNAEEELVKPALRGVKNVLTTATEKQTVKRVVLTSSVVAMYGDAIDVQSAPNQTLTESVWNTSSSLNHQPYPYSKTLAEREAWDMVEKQDQWDLVVINPGFILGPSLSKRTDSTSISFMMDLGNGKFKSGVPAGNHAMVDVRDVANAHVLAGFTPTASGRHICAAGTGTFPQMAKDLRELFPKLPLPKKTVPKWFFSIIAPGLGFTRKYVKRNIGIQFNIDNSYIKQNLGITFRPEKETLKDHMDQLIKDGLVNTD